MSIGLTVMSTVVSPFLLGYRNLSTVIHTIPPSLSASTLITTDAFHDTYSMSSLLFFGHILLLSANPLRSTPLDLTKAVSFAGSFSAKLLIAVVGIYLVRMIWKSRTVSRSYLFCAGIALLISTPTYTYRGVILVAYFYLAWRESSLFEEEDVGAQLDKGKISPIIDRRNEIVNSGAKPERLTERMKIIRKYAWLPILAPTTIFFINGTQFSAGSVLQPLALLLLLAIESHLLRLEDLEVQNPVHPRARSDVAM